MKKLIVMCGLLTLASCKSTSEDSSLKQGHRPINQTYFCDHTLIRGDYKVTYQLKFIYSGKNNEPLKARMQVSGIEKDAKKHPRTNKCMTSCKTWSDNRELEKVGDDWVAYRDDSTTLFTVANSAVKRVSGSFQDFSVIHHPQQGEGIDNVIIPIKGGSGRIAYTPY